MVADKVEGVSSTESTVVVLLLSGGISAVDVLRSLVDPAVVHVTITVVGATIIVVGPAPSGHTVKTALVKENMKE